MSGNAALEGAAPVPGPPPPPPEGTFQVQQNQQQQHQQQPPQVQQQQHQQPQTQQPPPPPPPAPEVDAEFMAVLAKTQNACLAEMGYYPTLLQEHLELKKQFALLRGDNQKLYSDNYNLAQCVQAQEQRLKQQQSEQGKRPRDDLEERVRRLTAERDELTGRLHSALNEVMILRQELSRFAPTAIMMPAHGYPPPPPQQQQQQQVVHHRMIPVPGPPAMVHVQQHPSNFIQYGGPPPPPHPGQHQNHRQIQPLPSHRQSHPALSPIDTSSTPTIAAHRRTSAPVVMTAQQHGAGPGPMSPSALAQFNGLTLASPAAPGSRPSTAGAPSTAPPQAYIPRPASGPPRAVPPQPRRTSTNPQNGAVIDLTEDEAKMHDGARKRRKTDHGPGMAAPPAQPQTAQGAMPITPVSPAFAPSAGQHVSQTLRAPAPSQLPPPPPSASAPPSNPQPAAATPQLSSSVSEPAAKPPPPNPPPENEDVNMDEQTTLEEDCLDANFDEDEADPDKLWCKMCRSRYKAGHTTEVPQPFVGIMPEELAAHCASVHPQGWEVLKRRIADLRAKEAAREA